MLLLIHTNIGIAESTPMEIGLAFLIQKMDLNEIETFDLKAPDYGAKNLNFWFDFRDGWHVVILFYNEEATLIPMDDIKILNGLCNLLPLFSQIQSEMPEGVEVSFTIAFTNENKLLITQQNYSDYLWN